MQNQEKAVERVRRRLEEELVRVQTRISEMGTEAAQMVTDAVQGLALDGSERKITPADAARAILKRDDALDEIEHDLEQDLLLLVAREQPVSDDLRLVGSALKVLGDIERIGDNAVNISRIGPRIEDAGLSRQFAETLAILRESSHGTLALLRLQQIADVMVRQATKAFVEGDEELAAEVIEHDDEADVLFAECEIELRGLLRRPPLTTGQEATAVIAYLLFVANYLERVCDHAVNVAERAIFFRTGQLPKPNQPE